MFDKIKNNLTLEEEAMLSANIADKAPKDLSANSVLMWQKIVVVAIDHKDIFGAIKLLREIKKLSSNFSSLPDEYQEISAWLGYCAMPDLRQEDIESFFKNIDFMIILEDDFYNDLIERIKWRLSTIDIQERDKWRERIYNAMHENQNNLTDNFIIQGKTGSIANWVKEYDAQIGVKIAESITRANFENETSTKAHLSDKEKSALKKFLDFYEFIKLSSYDPAGFEEDMVIESKGKTYINVNGEMVEVGDSNVIAREVRPFQKVSPLLPPHSAITQSAHSLLTQSNGNLSIILSQLQNSITNKDVEQTLGALLLLSQLRRLDNILEDPRFAQIIMNDLRRNNSESAIAGIRSNPTAPMHLARFLKITLEDNLNLSNQDALAFGAKLGKIMSIESEKYSSIVKNEKWNM